jgi:hypothetical protein
MNRVSIIWLMVAALSFAVAIALTAMVTSVSGRWPIGDERFQSDQPIQVLSIFAENPTAELGRAIAITYSERRSSDEARITMSFPAGTVARIVLNGIESPKSCSSPRSADQVMEDDAIGGGLNVEVTMLADDLYGSRLAVAAPAPSEFPFYVTCSVARTSTMRTFTSRTMRWDVIDFADVVYTRPAELAGLAPLPAMILDFWGIAGAEDFRFSNGFEMPELNNYEAKRVVLPGAFMTVTWNDIFQQQFRDILLIVIGTLIGIGVTVAIEGLRPLIERQSSRTKAPQG